VAPSRLHSIIDFMFIGALLVNVNIC
jgi:hypothetical protein